MIENYLAREDDWLRKELDEALKEREKKKKEEREREWEPEEAGVPYRNKNKAKKLKIITPQKLDRRLLATIAAGADTPAKIISTMRSYSPAELRISFERLQENKKIEVQKNGTVVATSKRGSLEPL